MAEHCGIDPGAGNKYRLLVIVDSTDRLQCIRRLGLFKLEFRCYVGGAGGRYSVADAIGVGLPVVSIHRLLDTVVDVDRR